MKWISLFLILIVVAGVIGISGCTNNTSNNSTSVNTSADVNRTVYADIGTEISRGVDWDVTLDKYDSFSKTQAQNELKKLTQNYGEQNIKNGTKTLNGYTIYYTSWTRTNGYFEETLFFEKRENWYKIDVNDKTGNNQAKIDSEIKYYMNKI